MARELRQLAPRATFVARATSLATRHALRSYLWARYGGRGLHFESGVHIHGFPAIEAEPGSRIWIGKNATLNSKRAQYHANMHSPVRLVTSRRGASIEIGAQSRIHGSCLHARRRIRLGSRCLVAANCQIIDSSGHDASFSDPAQRICTTDEPRPICIQDDVWLGLGCIVLPGVTIGRGCIVAAGSVVAHSLPPMTICSGVPAAPVRSYSDL